MMNPSTEIDYEMIQELLQGYYHLTPEILQAEELKFQLENMKKKYQKVDQNPDDLESNQQPVFIYIFF